MKIENFKNITIAYMRNTGEYGLGNQILMDNLKSYVKQHDLLNESTIILGIALDDPNELHKDSLRYDVGFILDGFQKTNLDTRLIDDGNYSIFEIEHTLQGVSNFWNNVDKHLNELDVDRSKPIIERYTTGKIAKHLCEFCIPLKN